MTPRHSLLSLVLFLAAVAFLSLGGCGYAKHVDPPLYTYTNAKVTEESARLFAAQVGGTYSQNVCCGSMEPLVHEGDWVVVAPYPFRDELAGHVGVYKPEWNKRAPVMHRFVSGNAKDGFIASGDNNPSSEASERVTAANYVGELVAIYRFKP